MKVICNHGGYYAISVVENYDLEKSIRWHGWNWKAGHVGIFACTRHGLTLVGVVSCADKNQYTWWRDGFADVFYVGSYNQPVDETLAYFGAADDLEDCISDAVEFENAEAE